MSQAFNTIISNFQILFVKGARTLAIESLAAVHKFEAGKLSALGLGAEQTLYSECLRYAGEFLGYDRKTNTCATRMGNILTNFLMDTGTHILMADVSQSLTPARLIELYTLDEDYVTKMYDLAITLNPKLNPARAAELAQIEATKTSSNTEPSTQVGQEQPGQPTGYAEQPAGYAGSAQPETRNPDGSVVTPEQAQNLG